MPHSLDPTSPSSFLPARRLQVSGVVAYFRLSQEAKSKALQDTSFAAGLRGIAALFVVSSHLVLCYATALVNACCAPNSSSPYLFQRPILRLPAAGHSWLAIFFILLGFVNALKPINLARSGQADQAAANLARGAFARICRLMLPAAVATIISWVICQLGLYEVARQSDAFWLHDTSPIPSPNIWEAFVDLKNALRDTWMFGRGNDYDQPQWAIIHLLQGSMMVIGALYITTNMSSLWRTATLTIFSIWSIDWSRELRDPWVGPACFSGMLLAELNSSSIPSRMAPYSRLLTPPLVIFSLVLMSYPGNNPDSQPWSAALHSFGSQYLPGDAEGSLTGTYGTIGGVILIGSIITSPHARWFLSQRSLKWLGKVSFAIYLVHGTIIRTILAWIMLLGEEKEAIYKEAVDRYVYEGQKYKVPGPVRCAVATIVSLGMILIVSQLWNAKVEPTMANITVVLEKLVTGRLSKDTVGRVRSQDGNEKGSVLPISRAEKKSPQGSPRPEWDAERWPRIDKRVGQDRHMSWA